MLFFFRSISRGKKEEKNQTREFFAFYTPMKFDDLSTEILLEVFQCLDYLDLFRAFYDLNSRFNRLILTRYQAYQLNFQSVTRNEVHLICQRHLPVIVSHVISLKLVDSDQTPDLLEVFLIYNITFDRFYYLQSLSLDGIHSVTLLHQMLSQCQDLSYLTHVSLLQCHFQEQDDVSHLFVHVWKLPYLTHCRIESRFPYEVKFSDQMIIFISLKYLSMGNFCLHSDDLSHLFHCTPSLQSFHGVIQSHSDRVQWRASFPSIVSMKLSLRKICHSIHSFLSKLPNLTRLILKIKDSYLNGYDWKQIIQNNCSKLTIFRLKMDFRFTRWTNAEEQLDILINSFRSSFWIEEHPWFVRCDWISTNLSNFGTLYTLPYAFKEFLVTNTTWSKSTGSIDDEYDHVRTLTVINLRTNLSNNSPKCSYDFRNIQHLQLHLPLKDGCWSMIHSFNQLRSLDVVLMEKVSYRSLQILLDHSPYLTSLCLGNYNHLHIIHQLTSISINRLDFLTKNRYKRYFDHHQCDTLSDSSLGRQCRFLLIPLEHRMNIVQLIENMSHLQVLTCQCKDDDSSTNDDLILWLRNHLPATCSIRRDRLQTSTIRLWIDRQAICQ